jgi:GNAT superfamily N-acetyltransferase
MEHIIRGPAPGDSAACERILRALPDWFGIEAALVQYTRDVATMPTFTAFDARGGEGAGGGAVGLLSVHRHYDEAAEIHLMAVLPQWHGRGVGRALVRAAEDWLRGEGVRFLQVKTVSEGSADPHYARTREFYRKAGFTPLEEFPLLWDPRNPALQLVKAL